MFINRVINNSFSESCLKSHDRSFRTHIRETYTGSALHMNKSRDTHKKVRTNMAIFIRMLAKLGTFSRDNAKQDKRSYNPSSNIMADIMAYKST